MGEIYPLMFRLYSEDDCSNGIKIMTGKDSIKTVGLMKKQHDELLPYYEYRDSAMSKLGPFKPEWMNCEMLITLIRNLEVAYNNGHFYIN